MKTAEEWMMEVNIPTDVTLNIVESCDKSNIELIKQIQLDAWKQGAKLIAVKLGVETMKPQYELLSKIESITVEQLNNLPTL